MNRAATGTRVLVGYLLPG